MIGNCRNQVVLAITTNRHTKVQRTNLYFQLAAKKAASNNPIHGNSGRSISLKAVAASG